MYKYEIFFGYNRETGGYPLLGEIEYAYPLGNGDVVILSGELFDKLESVALETEKSDLKYTQSWRIASIHHYVDSKNNLLPSIYIVNESDYLNKYKD